MAKFNKNWMKQLSESYIWEMQQSPLPPGPNQPLPQPPVSPPSVPDPKPNPLEPTRPLPSRMGQANNGGYLPPDIINFIIRTLGAMGGDYYGLIQNGQINWANWALQTASNPEFSSYIAPLLQAISGQLGSSAMQQFATAFRQWQASQSRQ